LSLYVDKITKRPVPRNKNYYGGKWAFFWCHLWADSEAELRAYVDKVKLSNPKYQPADRFCPNVHLQILSATRDIAVKNGAIDMSPKSIYASAADSKKRRSVSQTAASSAAPVGQGRRVKFFSEQFELFKQ
jgi:hypothetical protein